MIFEYTINHTNVPSPVFILDGIIDGICPLGVFGAVGSMLKYVIKTLPSAFSGSIELLPSVLSDIETSISFMSHISTSKTSYETYSMFHIDASAGALLQPAFQQTIQ